MFIKRTIFIIFSLLFTFFINFIIFRSIFCADSLELIFPFTEISFKLTGSLLHIIKYLYLYSLFISSLIYSNLLFNDFFNKKNINYSKLQKNQLKDLHIYVSKDGNGIPVIIPRAGLYQNILITGTIGTGKTSSAMYPFSKQLLQYECTNNEKKLGMLILDVKGNYYSQIKKYCKQFNRENDLIVISLNGNIKYNPLDKPNLKPSVLANRLKTILTLFSPNNSESYWLDKVEQVLAESIKLCRLYNNNYVTFTELHKLITFPDYYKEKISKLKSLFLNGVFSNEDIHNLLSSLEFFEKELNLLDQRTLSILKSEITRITGCFISDYSIQNIFCPEKNEINFNGFSDVVNKGKIVVLSMNISEFRNLSKIMAAYLKLDFQTEVMSKLAYTSPDKLRTVAFISDEYHEYVTDTDAAFFAQSREAKCINIVATQSYTSLMSTISNQYIVKAIVQNLINKLWFRTDDLLTVEDAQKQIGKEEKEKTSFGFSENSDTGHNNFFASIYSHKVSSSETFNKYKQLDFVYDTNFFTRELETFSCVAFISDGTKILPLKKLNLIPYYILDKNLF